MFKVKDLRKGMEENLQLTVKQPGVHVERHNELLLDLYLQAARESKGWWSHVWGCTLQTFILKLVLNGQHQCWTDIAFLECHFGIYYFHTGRLCAVKDIFVTDHLGLYTMPR